MRVMPRSRVRRTGNPTVLDLPLVPSRASGWASSTSTGLLSYLLTLAVLLGGYVLGLYFNATLPLGDATSVVATWHQMSIYLLMAASVAIVLAVQGALTRFGATSQTTGATQVLGASLLTVLGMSAFLPHTSGLSKLSIVASSLALAVLVLPGTGPKEEPADSVWRSLGILRRNTSLLRIWVNYNVRARYSQAILGVLWIILLPLATAVVLSIVFSNFMRVHISNVPFIAFFLAGFAPWTVFNQSVAASMRAIISSMHIINQVYFPREIIVLSALGEALVDGFFMFLAVFAVELVVGVHLTAVIMLLPLVLGIELVLLLGVMFIVSYTSVFVRDIPQLTTVLLQLMFYLAPIMYPLSIVPERFRFIIAMNPVTPIVVAVREILVYGHVPNWLSLGYPGVLGVGLLIFGYRTFKRGEDQFADLV